MALKAQFKNFEHNLYHFSFSRTENQILKIIEDAKKKEDSIILYTIVDNKLAKFLSQESNKKNIPCFGVLGDLILNFSKLLNQKATNIPSGQHVLNEEYYKRIEAIQFTMNHDDGNSLADVEKSDIILLGASRTSKTPTSIYLANRGFKTSNIPLVNENSIPNRLKDHPKTSCIIGLTAEPKRLHEVRKNRLSTIKEKENIRYTSLETIQNEIDNSRKTFKKYQWPIIDVTRKSVEETAASVIKIYEIYLSKK
tara:strand:- start:405 stop:1163 length:759 start_codon:yes stop_codon:yes gene_type:complete